jgi:hypothetical protein
MLVYLNSIEAYRPGRPTSRKLRLFACATVRMVWDQLADGPCRTAVEVAERFADGQAGPEELIAAREAALRVWQVSCGSLQLIHKAAHKAAGWDAVRAAKDAAAALRRFDANAGRAQCHLLRDIFGPRPFRPVNLDEDRHNQRLEVYRA